MPPTSFVPPLWVVVASACFARLTLFTILNTQFLLEDRVELVTPVSSFKTLREGLFLYQNGLNPYTGSLVHHSPLFFPPFALLFSTLSLLPTFLASCLIPALFVVVDLITALHFAYIARHKAASDSQEVWHVTSPLTLHNEKKEEGESEPLEKTGNSSHSRPMRSQRKDASSTNLEGKARSPIIRSDIQDVTIPVDTPISPTLVAAVYLFNPYTILTCLSKSTNVFGNLFAVMAVSNACDGKVWLCMILLALASCLNLYPLMLLPPCILLIRSHYKNRPFSLNPIFVRNRFIRTSS